MLETWFDAWFLVAVEGLSRVAQSSSSCVVNLDVSRCAVQLLVCSLVIIDHFLTLSASKSANSGLAQPASSQQFLSCW